MNQHRPDFSNFLAHFTTNRAPVSRAVNNPTAHVRGSPAIDRLISILDQRKIIASRLPWVGRNAVCFTECPWGSLIEHARRYSPYALGFNKPLIFASGGGPAYYVRADHYDQQNWEPNLHTFVTPFWPQYRPGRLRNNGILKNRDVDYSHEREWRVPHDLTFKYQHVEFVILDNYEDMAQFPKQLKDAVERDRFLLMDNYRQIEKLWPVHRLALLP